MGLGLALALAACTARQQDGDEARSEARGEVGQEARGGAQDPADAPAKPIPATAEAFLAELLPLPDGAEAIEVEYTITGPALSGSLTTLMTVGGRRRDRWALRATAGDGELQTTGFTITTASDVFTGTTPGTSARRANHLDALARAYLQLDAPARAAVVESIRAWHQTLAEQRTAHAGERDEILGVSCLQTRVAAQNVCMWEETGVPLRYAGAAFTIEATKIDRSPKIDAATFEPPADVAALEREAPDETHDYAQILGELADGSYAQVAVLVLGAKGVPDLRLATTDGAETTG